ncbi:MAG: YciI family protein [Planctomycetaceae bacterium]
MLTLSALQYVPIATSARVRNGQTQMTTGPFAETAEQPGGFYILDLENREQTEKAAARSPGEPRRNDRKSAAV